MPIPEWDRQRNGGESEKKKTSKRWLEKEMDGVREQARECEIGRARARERERERERESEREQARAGQSI